MFNVRAVGVIDTCCVCVIFYARDPLSMFLKFFRFLFPPRISKEVLETNLRISSSLLTDFHAFSVFL
jgi:hypothetical protein